MASLESMSPTQYLDHMWSEYECATGGRTDLYRWRDGVTELDDMPGYLSPSDALGRKKALNDVRANYRGLEDLWRQTIPSPILRAMNSNDRYKCESLLVALFPTYSIDSKFARTPRGDRLILVHAGMSAYLARLLIPFSRVFAGGTFTRHDQVEMLKDVSMHWLAGAPIAAVKPSTNPESLVHAYLFDACQKFVVGHEFGHAVIGHVAYSTDRVSNHKMEYDADEYGARLLFEVMARGITSKGEEGRPTECYGLLAPAIVLGGYSIFMSSDTVTHPKPLDRMMTFIENYRSYVPQSFWPKAHLDIVLKNVIAVAEAFYKWADRKIL